jgi:hypothetical protein
MGVAELCCSEPQCNTAVHHGLTTAAAMHNINLEPKAKRVFTRLELAWRGLSTLAAAYSASPAYQYNCFGVAASLLQGLRSGASMLQ